MQKARVLAGLAGALIGAGVAVYEVRWLGRSSLAPVVLLLGLGVCLAGAAGAVPAGKE